MSDKAAVGGPVRSTLWNQPLCTDCWVTEAGHPAVPHRLVGVDWADLITRCCVCNRWTAAGILVRRDPALVPYPTME